MNLLNKIEVVVSFPLGANFYQNIIDYTYKQFLKMLKSLSCININSRCVECSFNKDCQYYKLTGENFSGYPGIFFNKNGFEGNIFRDNEEFIFEIYVIGDCDKYKSYIDIFFEEYLNHKLAGFFFHVKKIEKYAIEEYTIKDKTIHINTVIESVDLMLSYNQMTDYYNSHYNCQYSPLKRMDNIKGIRNIRHGRRHLLTKTINISGYVYRIDILGDFSSHILEIGIGKYNYLGGGKVEIKNKTRG